MTIKLNRCERITPPSYYPTNDFINEVGIKDCYEKQSPNDAEGMAGDRSRNLRSGRLRQKRADTKAKTLAKHYKEFCRIGSETSLGVIRQITGLVAIADIIKYIRGI